jgi:hypothetical protein
MELRRFTREPSATALSMAAPFRAGFEKVELFRRLIRFVEFTVPSEAVWECARL